VDQSALLPRAKVIFWRTLQSQCVQYTSSHLFVLNVFTLAILPRLNCTQGYVGGPLPPYQLPYPIVIVADPDTYVFGPPGSGSFSQSYGS
jgi:hypothetical protein